MVNAALAAAFLALPATGSAQTKPRTPAATSRSAPAAARPAPAPAISEPEPVPAPEPAPRIEERGPWRITGAIGYENDSGDELTGPRLEIGLERDLVALGGRGQLSFVAAAAWSLGMHSASASAAGLTVKTDVTQNLYELVPGFRASYAVVPRLRIFAELGVGGGSADATTEIKTSPGLLPTEKSSASETFGVVRFSTGASYQLNDRVRLGVLLPTFSKRYGATASKSLAFSATAAYAF